MTIFNARDILSLPGGDNATDTLIGNVHFNKTTLEHWNYTLYSNGTISNGSSCFLTFEPYAPVLLLTNGTFINATWCYSPVNSIGLRGGVGVGFAVVFALSLVMVLVNLHKHGRSFLPVEKRFYPIGRRWQWYWAIFVCAAAVISLFTNVDVDRYYILELPIVLNSFFWFLMQQGTMAVVWEAVRHWGSWMERQFIDPNPFVLKQDDRRSKFELYLPIWFYMWLWLNVFMVVPRNWGEIEMQRSPDQTAERAIPTATDVRFKVGALCLLICWLTTVASLRHSIRHYKPRHRGIFNRALGFASYVPLRFVFIVPLALCLVAYQGLVSFIFDFSVLNAKGNIIAIYAGGYGPALLIVIIQCIYGWANPNEDSDLIRQRREREQAIDQEMGIVKKPAWWRRAMRDDHNITSVSDRLARNVRELGGGNATARGMQQNFEVQAREAERQSAAGIEMGNIRRSGSTSTAASSETWVVDGSKPVQPYLGKSDRRRTERTMSGVASLLFPNAGPSTPDRRAELMLDGPPPPPYTDRGRNRDATSDISNVTNERSNSTSTAVSITAPPQQVRSMLDI